MSTRIELSGIRQIAFIHDPDGNLVGLMEERR